MTFICTHIQYPYYIFLAINLGDVQELPIYRKHIKLQILPTSIKSDELCTVYFRNYLTRGDFGIF